MRPPLTLAAVLVVLMILPAAGRAAATDPAAGPALPSPTTAPVSSVLDKLLPQTQTPGGVGSMLQWLVVITVLSIAPAVVVMVTSFTRIIVVLGLLRQALATQQLPPNQVMFGLALFMTLAVMAPVYNQVHQDAVAPYLDGKISQADALEAGTRHVRAFMINQIEAGGNTSDVYLFLRDDLGASGDLKWRDVPTFSLIPAYVVSELKIAFYMGFRIYLPFLIIDMLVASVLISMGMLMVPPVLISLPFKLLLFVLADGWHLVVGTLMRSFG